MQFWVQKVIIVQRSWVSTIQELLYPLSNEIHPLEASPFEAMNSLYDLFFYFCWKLALETWVDFSITSLGVHNLDHIHSLASSEWSGFSNQWILLLTENRFSARNWASMRAEEQFLCLFFRNRKEMAHATSANQGLSTASQHSCHVHDIMPVCAKQERNGPASAHQGPPIASQDMLWMYPPTSPYPIIYAITKPISKMKMWPKLHNKDMHH